MPWCRRRDWLAWLARGCEIPYCSSAHDNQHDNQQPKSHPFPLPRCRTLYLLNGDLWSRGAACNLTTRRRLQNKVSRVCRNHSLADKAGLCPNRDDGLTLRTLPALKRPAVETTVCRRPEISATVGTGRYTIATFAHQDSPCRPHDFCKAESGWDLSHRRHPRAAQP